MIELAATLILVPIFLFSVILYVHFNRCVYFRENVPSEQITDDKITSLDLEERLDTYKRITDVYESTLSRLPSMIEMNYYLRQVIDESEFKFSDIRKILQESNEYQTNAHAHAHAHVTEETRGTARFSPMDPNYYNNPINLNIMDVFFEASKCVTKAGHALSKQIDTIPMISGIAFDDSYEYKQPLAKYSNDRNMNELMGNIARNTYYLNNKPDHTEQIVSQPVVYPSNMSSDILYDLENILGDKHETGSPYTF